VTTPYRLRVDLNSNTFQYKRKVFNFLEVTGIIGGLFELFEVVFGIIIGIISSYSLRGQLIDEIKNNGLKNKLLEKELNLLKQKWLSSREEKERDLKSIGKNEKKDSNIKYDYI